jgi:hypothetical protein
LGFSRVYGLNADSESQHLWELSGVFSWREAPWCMVGDFNVTRFRNEKVGVCRLTFAMWEFSDFISEQGLMVSHWLEVPPHDLTIKTPFFVEDW